MLRGPSVASAARWSVLLAVAHAAPAEAASTRAQREAPREFAEVSQGGAPIGLPTVRWVTADGGDRRVDVYAFDCARSRYAHIVSERYRGQIRVERVALVESRWSTAMQSLPPKYPVLAVHRARALACAPKEPRR